MARLRAALVLTGLLRDYERGHRAFFSQLMADYGISSDDVYISAWTDRGYWYPGDAAELRSFSTSGRILKSEILKTYPGAKVELHPFEEMRPRLTNLLSQIPEVYLPSLGRTNYLVRGINLASMFFQIESGLNMIDDLESYDVVIRSRPDIVLKSVPSLKSISKRMMILKQTNHLGGGTGDSFHAGPASQFEPFLQVTQRFRHLALRNQGLVCPHLFTQSLLRESGIRYTEFKSSFEVLHTPVGMYHALDSDGSWRPLHEANYIRVESFKGLDSGE